MVGRGKGKRQKTVLEQRYSSNIYIYIFVPVNPMVKPDLLIKMTMCFESTHGRKKKKTVLY